MTRNVPEINSVRLYQHDDGSVEPMIVKGMENTNFVMVDDSEGNPQSIPQSKLKD